MPKPKFIVKHFIACRGVSWYGGAGPKPPYTLEEVGFEFPVERDAEPPFDFPELWIYTRIYRMNAGVGTRRFSIAVYRSKPDGTESLIATLKRIPVNFRDPNQTSYEKVWCLRNIGFPALGDYTIRLLFHYRKWSVLTKRIVATEYMRIGIKK